MPEVGLTLLAFVYYCGVWEKKASDKTRYPHNLVIGVEFGFLVAELYVNGLEFLAVELVIEFSLSSLQSR